MCCFFFIDDIQFSIDSSKNGKTMEMYYLVEQHCGIGWLSEKVDVPVLNDEWLHTEPLMGASKEGVSWGQVTCDRSNTSASLPSLFQEMKKPSWSTLNLQPSSTSSSLQRSKVSPSRSGLSTGMCHSRTNALVILTPPGDWGLGSRQSRGASTAISIARLLKECTHTLSNVIQGR